jgi:hypothetical protein
MKSKRQNPKTSSQNACLESSISRFEEVLLEMDQDPKFVPSLEDQKAIGLMVHNLNGVDPAYLSRMFRRFGAFIVREKENGQITVSPELEIFLERNFGVLIRQCLIWNKGAKSKTIYINKKNGELVGPLPEAIKKCERLLLNAMKSLSKDPWDGLDIRLERDLDGLIDGTRKFLAGLKAEHSYDKELSTLELRTLRSLSIDLGEPMARKLMNAAITWSNDAGLAMNLRAEKWNSNRVGRLLRHKRKLLNYDLKWEKVEVGRAPAYWRAVRVNRK